MAELPKIYRPSPFSNETFRQCLGMQSPKFGDYSDKTAFMGPKERVNQLKIIAVPDPSATRETRNARCT